MDEGNHQDNYSLMEDNRLKKIRPNFHETEIKKQIIDGVQKIKETDWSNVNLVILEYLKNSARNTVNFINLSTDWFIQIITIDTNADTHISGQRHLIMIQLPKMKK